MIDRTNRHQDQLVDLTWTEKYVTYQQDENGCLAATDYHFLAEVCYADRSKLDNVQAALFIVGAESALATYAGSDPYTFTNGIYYTRKSKSYDDLAALNAAHPADNQYVWELKTATDLCQLPPICIGGTRQQTQIPPVSPIFLLQDGQLLKDVQAVAHNKPLTISWNPFTTGRAHTGTVWDDLIFVLVSDTEGEVVFTGGAPGDDGGFINFEAPSCVMPAGILDPGTDYVVFISQVKYVDHNVCQGIEQLAANSFAVELPVRTAGTGKPSSNPVIKAPYLWGGKTPETAGMVPWPAFLSFSR